MKSLWLSIIFLLFSFGAHADTEVGNEILIGQSASFSGSFAEMAESYRDGALLYFDEVNRRGGIYKRKIRLISMDDKHDVNLTLANTRKLIDEDKVLALALYTWTPMVRAAIPLAAEKKVPFFAPYAGAPDIYHSSNKYVFTIRASTHAEVETIVRYFATAGIREIALVRYNDKVGDQLREELVALLDKYNIKITGEGSMTINTADVAKMVAQLSKAPNPQAIFLGVSGSDAVAFIRGYEKVNGKKAPYFARSLVGVNQLAKELGPQAAGIAVTQLMPSPFKKTLPITQEYVRLLLKKNAAAVPDYISMEGFVAARVFCEALERAGPHLTSAGFVDAMSHLGSVQMGGFEVKFAPDRHNGSEYVDLMMIGHNGRMIE